MPELLQHTVVLPNIRHRWRRAMLRRRPRHTTVLPNTKQKWRHARLKGRPKHKRGMIDRLKKLQICKRARRRSRLICRQDNKPDSKPQPSDKHSVRSVALLDAPSGLRPVLLVQRLPVL